jgi:hypothetical protein
LLIREWGQNADFGRRFHRGDAEDAEFFWVEEETGIVTNVPIEVFRENPVSSPRRRGPEFFWVEEE